MLITAGITAIFVAFLYDHNPAGVAISAAGLVCACGFSLRELLLDVLREHRWHQEFGESTYPTRVSS